MRCRARESRSRARADTDGRRPRPLSRTRDSIPPGRTKPWRRWRLSSYRLRTRAYVLKRMKRFEPSSYALEAFVIPLIYTRGKRKILGHFPSGGEQPLALEWLASRRIFPARTHLRHRD